MTVMMMMMMMMMVIVVDIFSPSIHLSYKGAQREDLEGNSRKNDALHTRSMGFRTIGKTTHAKRIYDTQVQSTK